MHSLLDFDNRGVYLGILSVHAPVGDFFSSWAPPARNAALWACWP